MSAANFGSWPTPVSDGGVDDEGRQNFGVAVFARVHIEKEIGERAFEPRSESFVNRETRSRYFHRGLKIQNSCALAEFPVRPRREIEFRRLARTPHLHVVRCAFAHGDARVRNIRNGQQKFLQCVVHFGDKLVAALDFFGRFLHLAQKRVSLLLAIRHVLALRFEVANRFLQRANNVVGFVALRLHLLGGGDQFAPLGIHFDERTEVQLDAAVARHLLDHVHVLSYESKVQHRGGRITET